MALLRLWCAVAEFRSDGRLIGWDSDDVAEYADWSGDAAEFVRQLIELKWLDDLDGLLVCHNWKKWQPWAAGAEARREASRVGNAVKRARRLDAIKSGGDAAVKRARSESERAQPRQALSHDWADPENMEAFNAWLARSREVSS